MLSAACSGGQSKTALLFKDSNGLRPLVRLWGGYGHVTRIVRCREKKCTNTVAHLSEAKTPEKALYKHSLRCRLLALLRLPFLAHLPSSGRRGTMVALQVFVTPLE